MPNNSKTIPPSSDPQEQKLREAWHAARAAYEDNPGPLNAVTVSNASRAIADYLWNRTQREVEADRAKHPKAKRNAAKGSELAPRDPDVPETPTRAIL